MDCLFVGAEPLFNKLARAGLLDPVAYVESQAALEGMATSPFLNTASAIIVDTSYDLSGLAVETFLRLGNRGSVYLLGNGLGSCLNVCFDIDGGLRSHVFRIAGTGSRGESCLETVLTVHKTPEFRAAGFLDAGFGLRMVEVGAIELPDQDISSLGESCEDLALPALEAAELLIGDLREAVQGVAAQAETYGRRDLWVLWEDELKPAKDTVAAVLSEKKEAVESLRALRRFAQAEALLLGFLQGIRARQAPDFKRMLFGAGFRSGEARSHLRKLEELEASALKIVQYYLNEELGSSGTGALRMPRFKKRGLWSRIVRHTDLAAAHEACRLISSFLLRIVSRAEFRDLLAIKLLDLIWSRHCGEQEGLSRSATMLTESVRSVLQSIRGETVVVGLPRDSFPGWGHERVKERLKDLFGISCDVLLTDAQRGWLYCERALHASELRHPEREGHSTVPPIAVPLEILAASSAPVLVESIVADGQADREWPAENRCPECDSSSRTGDGQNDAAGEGPPKMCPKCGHYNRKHWWQCCRHGKIPIDVSVADDRCPECILRHHRDPANFPLSSIAVRPELLKDVLCPHCSRLYCRNRRHERYSIPEEILPYYLNGVAASEEEDFLKLARAHGLAEDCRCPNCRTLLIPIHHREGGTCEDTRAGGWEEPCWKMPHRTSSLAPPDARSGGSRDQGSC
ncbi:MAG: hypothetical protein ABUT39_27350 [Acidobacteriota bacterium]